MASLELARIAAPPDLDLELVLAEKSGARAIYAAWHRTCCTCSCKTGCHLQQPPAIHIRQALLPKYQPLADLNMTILAKRFRHSLSRKEYGKFMQHVRWTWLSAYHRLHLLVLLPNISTMAILGAKHQALTLPTSELSLAVAVNITAAVLIRQEVVINMLFAFFGKCPRWVPLRIRCLVAKIYHLGGIHSGAAIAATLWYTLLNIVTLKDYLQSNSFGQTHQFPTAIITFIINILFVAIIVLSLPNVRAKFHNAFEAVHRFAGWTAVALFWVQLFLLADGQRKVRKPIPPLGAVICHNPVLYLLAIVTISLIMPWLRLRKVSVVSEPLSSHAIRLHFGYTNLPLCAAPRFSHNPLKEWHAFAGIPEDDGIGFSIIVSKAGDWTSRIIKSPPRSIWVRGIPVRGVLHIAPIFKSVVLVATGSGIGPIMSLLAAGDVKCRILWSTKDPLKTYRQRIVNDVLTADPEAVIVNTSGGQARPDLVQGAHDLYKESNAEAIFVISNPLVTRKVVFELETRGLPTFAPIFDS